MEIILLNKTSKYHKCVWSRSYFFQYSKIHGKIPVLFLREPIWCLLPGRPTKTHHHCTTQFKHQPWSFYKRYVMSYNVTESHGVELTPHKIQIQRYRLPPKLLNRSIVKCVTWFGVVEHRGGGRVVVEASRAVVASVTAAPLPGHSLTSISSSWSRLHLLRIWFWWRGKVHYSGESSVIS